MACSSQPSRAFPALSRAESVQIDYILCIDTLALDEKLAKAFTSLVAQLDACRLAADENLSKPGPTHTCMHACKGNPVYIERTHFNRGISTDLVSDFDFTRPLPEVLQFFQVF